MSEIIDFIKNNVLALTIISSIIIIFRAIMGVFRLFVHPRFCYKHRYRDRVWNTIITNQKGLLGSNASDCNAVVDFIRINADGSINEQLSERNLGIRWADTARYSEPISQTRSRPLEVLIMEDNYKKFHIVHEKGDHTVLDAGVYDIEIRIYARELRGYKKIKLKKIEIPEYLKKYSNN